MSECLHLIIVDDVCAECGEKIEVESVVEGSDEAAESSKASSKPPVKRSKDDDESNSSGG